MNNSDPSNEADRSRWIETEATIVSCRYQFAGLNTLTMGIQTGEKFRIAFEYYAHGRLYSGEFQSPAAIAQSSKIPIRYNPLQPSENTYSSSAPAGAGRQLMAIGVAGSVLLSLLWLAFLRGCS